MNAVTNPDAYEEWASLPPINGHEYESPATSTAEPAASADALDLVGFTSDELLAPIEPEKYLVDGKVPTEAYTLVAGGLSSAKTTFLHSLILQRATGYDFLGLDGARSSGVEIGPNVLVSYEDSDRRIRRRFQTLVQYQHERIRQTHGPRSASEYLERVQRNVRRVTLTGEAAAGIVYRVDGTIVPNEGLISRLLAGVRAFASRDVMIGLDPLRLAIVGSQNDDDGADVVVHTLNRIACALPDSGLIVPSHTTKAGAVEPGHGQAAQAYATSGSALYSQHARSNFHMARMRSEDIAKMFAPGALTDEEIERQAVTQLTHARLSHGAESGRLYYVMRGGVLEPIRPQADAADLPVDEQGGRFLAVLDPAIERLRASGAVMSANALERDPTLKKRYKRNELRDLIRFAQEQEWLHLSGEGKAREITLTPMGRNLASRYGEVR